MIPDFAQYYSLQLSDVAVNYSPCEVLALIAGLPGNSRYAARLAGEKYGAGWSQVDWLNFDMRNAIEALRATVVNIAAGKAKDKFRQWNHYPGYDEQEKKKSASKLDRLKTLAKPVYE